MMADNAVWPLTGFQERISESLAAVYNQRSQVYRGIWFSGAVLRDAYWKCINSAELAGFYKGLATGRAADLTVEDEPVYLVARDWAGKFEKNFRPAVRKKGSFWKTRYSIQEKLRITFSDIKRLLSGRESILPESEIWFFIEEEKHGRYLSPLVSLLVKKGMPCRTVYPSPWNLKKAGGNRESYVFLPVLPDLASFLYWKEFPFTRQIKQIQKTLGAGKPRAVVFAEGDSFSQYLVSACAAQSGITTLCVQWGAVCTPVPKPGWQNMNHTWFYSWGPAFGRIFQSFNPAVSVRNAGHISLTGFPDREKEKIILFAVQKVMPPFITLQQIELFIGFAIKTAENHPSWTVRIRNHPDFEISPSVNEAIRKVGNTEIHENSRYSLEQSFSQAQICISINSTTTLEGIKNLAIPVFYNTAGFGNLMGREVNRILWGIPEMTAEETEAKLDLLLADQAELNRVKKKTAELRELFFPEMPVPPLEQIANDLSGLLQDQQ